MYSKVGECSKCGAAMYSPTVCFSVTPTPVHRACTCFTGDTKKLIHLKTDHAPEGVVKRNETAIRERGGNHDLPARQTDGSLLTVDP